MSSRALRVALVEDEVPALRQLEALVARVAPGAVIVARLRTVRQIRAWLATAEPVDLVIADIELGDGLSLDAFAEAGSATPIVCATAHPQHLAPALAGNAIAYLAKPVRADELAVAIAKLDRLERHFTGQVAHDPVPSAASRLVGRRGLDWVGVDVADVAWIQVRAGATWCMVRGSAGPVGASPVEVLLDESLSSLQARLDPARFFRANRWTLVALDAIARVRAEGRGRLGLVVDPPVPAADGAGEGDGVVAVPQEGAAAFRAWFGMP